MANPSMPAVEPLRVPRIEVLHHAREWQVRRGQQEMEVIPQLTMRVTPYVEPNDGLRQDPDEFLVIPVVRENALFVVPSGHHMTGNSRGMNAKRTHHS